MASKNIQRRTLVKGAAWTLPVVATTAVVPAYAASTTSTCTIGLDIPRGSWQGVYSPTQANSTGDLYLNGNFGTVNITGLQPGVTVKKITSLLYYKRRTVTDSHTDGSFSPSESYTEFITDGYVPSSGTGVTMTAGNEYSFYDFNNNIVNTLTFVGDDIEEVYFPDTEATNSWAVQNVWSADNIGSSSQPTAITGSSANNSGESCGTFSVDMGGFLLKADDVYIGSVSEICNALTTYNTHLIELSDGTVLPLSVAKGQYRDDKCTNWKA